MRKFDVFITETEPVATQENAKPYFETELQQIFTLQVSEGLTYALPRAIDYEGEPVEIVVNLGDASSFVQYVEGVV